MEADNTMLLYPNPAGERIFVESKLSAGEVVAMLRNLRGRLVASQKIENQKVVEFDLTALPAGVYEVQIGQQSRLLVKK